MKIIKIFVINVLIFLATIASIEIIFGYWFTKDHIGGYMREHRMKKVPYTLTFFGKDYNYNYLRNYHGFRGEEIKPNKIQAVFIGGSTADERWKPDQFSIVGFLNDKLKNDSIKIKIINAGIEGQSTLGHLANFEKWFPKLDGFKPDLFIFYIGINDHLRAKFNSKDLSDGHVKRPGKLEFIKDSLKSKSIFYDTLRKVKHKYYINMDKVVLYDFDYSVKNYTKQKKWGDQNKYKFLSFDDALNFYNLNDLLLKNKKLIDYYLGNIDKLAKYTKKFNGKPIFINQITSNGAFNESLFLLNYSLIKHCKIKRYACIDLAKELEGQQDYWYDGVHTTPKGSKKISEIIYPKLKEIIEKN